MTKSIAAVLVGERALEFDEFEIPKIGGDDALLRVELCGICGSDIGFYDGDLPRRFGIPYPLVPGHEPVGIVEEIGAEAATRWGVSVGDRVAVEAAFRCGSCPACLTGSYLLCSGTKPGMGYGHTSALIAPSLWGGYAEHLFLTKYSVVHKVPDGVSREMAPLFNPLAGAVRWSVTDAGTRRDDTVVLFGPGQRGLASVITTKEAGAQQVIVTGVAADASRLALARELGADATINADEEDVVERVRELTGGAMADVAVDLSAGATQPVLDAMRVVKRGGTVVLVGLKHGREVTGFVSDDLVHNALTVKAGIPPEYPAVRAALHLLAAGRHPFEKLLTHTFALRDAERAIKVLAREELDGVDPICISIDPSRP